MTGAAPVAPWGGVLGMDDRAADVQFLHQVAKRFPRREPREMMVHYVRGLSAPASRKNVWTLAGLAGSSSPDAMQRLLRTAEWDLDGVRDDLRAEVVARLGSEQSLWILDEAAFRKRGHASVGVDRQYMRTVRRLENCQLGVFLLHATSRGQGLVDRELYLPLTWTESDRRRRAAHVPDDVVHVSKADLGLRMLERAHAAGALDGWVTADKSYGASPALRTWLQERGVPNVLAINNDERMVSSEGEGPSADGIVQRVLADATSSVDEWHPAPIAAGPYAGEVFDWAGVELGRKGLPAGWAQWLLIRRQVTPSPGTHHLKTACYRCVGPAHTPVGTLVQIAGARWRSELGFERARTEFGLDQYQVRDWRAWYAHVTLSMVAATMGLAPVDPSERSR